MSFSFKKYFEGPGGIREMLVVALPMVVSSACDTVMIFTDRLFLARLGSESMSAAMGGGLTSFMMSTFFLGLTGYCTALTAQYLGAGRKDRCAITITQGLIISLLAYPLILLCRPLALSLFEFLSLAPGQLALQKTYFNILIYGSILGLIRNCLSAFFSGIGRTRWVMISALAAMGINVVANYLLIYGKCGFPALGIAGAAYGTLLGGFCGLVILIAAYLSRDNRLAFGIAKSFRFDGDVMRRLIRFGYPTGVEFFMNMLAFNLLILMFHAAGPATAAAITVVFNWDLVSFVPMIGVHVGVISLVGRHMGAGSPDTAHRATLSGLKLACLYSLGTLIAFAVFPEFLVGIFRPAQTDPAFDLAFPRAVFMLRMASLYVMADAIMLVFGGALRGAGDTFWAMCISVTLHWILVAQLWLAQHIFHWSPETSWLTLCTTLMAFSGILYLRYRSGRWRTLRIVEPAPFIERTDGLLECPP
jgi:MATE family multidrug resistance protein